MAISGGAIAGGLAAGLSGLPGAIDARDTRRAKQQAAGNSAVQGISSQIAGDPQMQALTDPSKALNVMQQPGLDINSSLDKADQQRNQFTDATHPAWQVLNNMTGGAAPSPISTDNNGMVNAPISVGQQNQMTGGDNTQLLQNGGVVRANYGKHTIAPSFERGPVLPTGPNNTVTGPTSPTMQGTAGYEGGGVVDGYAHGGMVGDTAMGQGITPASTEGQMLMFDAGGVVPQGFMPNSGNINVPMTGAAAGLVQGMQAGQALGYNMHQMALERQNREDAAQYGGRLAGIDVNNPNSGSAPPTQEGFLGKAKDDIEGFFQHLHGVSLDDNHKPNNAQAISAPSEGTSATTGSPLPSNGQAPAAPSGSAAAPPSTAPSPAGAAVPQPGAGPSQPTQPNAAGQAPVNPVATPQAQVAAAKELVSRDPNVAAGIPSKSPTQSNQPHSMTPEQWNELTLLKQKAVMSAARAGEDPAKVYESLTAMQNAHFQGQLLKQAATGYQAYQNGDMDAVARSLKNMNYYLPNGQDIDIKRATAANVAKDPALTVGDVMHSNPFYKMYGHEGEKEYIKVDAPYLQQIGSALLDPRTAQEAQLKSYSAQQEAQSNRIKAQGEFMTGQGRQLTGSAAYQKAGLAAQGFNADQRLKVAAGNKDQAEANWYNTRQPSGSTGQPKITMASLRSLQNDAATYTDRIVQGQPTTSPVMVSDGSGGTTPNLSPGAGKAIPDASRIPAWATNGMDKTGKPVPLTPEQQENVKVLGGQINSANAGLAGMNTPKAVELAARITHYQSHPTTHTDPATGKPAKDFVYDRDNGTAHVWVGNAYENVYLKPNVADESGAGGGPEAPPPGGNSAPGSGGGENEGPNAFQ